MISVLSGITRKGVWQVPERIDNLNLLGATELDMRQATFTARETRIRAICLLGGLEVTVPPEVHVIDNGFALLGGREMAPDTEESMGPHAPILRITGISLLGAVTVRRKRRKGENGSNDKQAGA
jgi:hypothetical protein